MGRPPKKRARQEDANVLDMLGSTSDELLANLPFDWPFELGSIQLDPALATSTSTGLGPLDFSSGADLSGQLLPGTDQKREPVIVSDDMSWLGSAPTSSQSQPMPVRGTSSSAPPPVPMPTTGTQGQNNINCPCLSYMYLTLSALCMVNSTPVTFQTIHTIENATRTAQSVLRCEICPRSFMTGSQNVSLLSTLLNILVDLWIRIWESDAEALSKQLASPAYQLTLSAESVEVANASRRHWLRQFVRRGLIGGPLAQETFLPSIFSDETPDVLSLIREMEDRQRRWHARGASRLPMTLNQTSSSPGSQVSVSSPSTSPGSMTTDTTTYSTTTDGASSPYEIGVGDTLSTPGFFICTGDRQENSNSKDKHEHLCLKVIETAKVRIQKFGFEPAEYPEGVEPL